MSYIPQMAFLTGSVGAGEWIMLFAVILVVVGPRRLPEVARKLGRTMEMFRRAADEFKEQLMSMDQEITKTVSDASAEPDSGKGASDYSSADSYEPSYDYDAGAYDGSDYPGNEGIAAEWNSDSESSALESDDLADTELNSAGDNIAMNNAHSEGNESVTESVSDSAVPPQTVTDTDSDAVENKS